MSDSKKENNYNIGEEDKEFVHAQKRLWALVTKVIVTVTGVAVISITVAGFQNYETTQRLVEVQQAQNERIKSNELSIKIIESRINVVEVQMSGKVSREKLDECLQQVDAKQDRTNELLMKLFRK